MHKTLFTTVLTLAALITFSAQAEMSNAEKQKLAQNVLEADGNDDGALTRNEFKRLIDLNAADKLGRAEQIRSRGLYDRAFQRLDGNGDGFLTRQEMQALAAARG